MGNIPNCSPGIKISLGYNGRMFLNTFTPIFIGFFLLYSLIAFLLGIKNRKNPFGLCKYFNLLGSYVWIDNTIFGLFFTVVSLVCLLFQQWVLFWLAFSIFWTVRSIGEQIYWFLEQFATPHRNPPHTLWPHRWFKGQEVWVVMQITMQCVSVVSIISTIYFINLWLK